MNLFSADDRLIREATGTTFKPKQIIKCPRCGKITMGEIDVLFIEQDDQCLHCDKLDSDIRNLYLN